MGGGGGGGIFMIFDVKYTPLYTGIASVALQKPLIWKYWFA